MRQTERYNVQTGVFPDGPTYARMGDKPNILLNIESLSFKHESPSGFTLKHFIKSHRLLASEYTIYTIGRQLNLPDDHFMEQMAVDYARRITREFGKRVDVIGTSIGG